MLKRLLKYLPVVFLLSLILVFTRYNYFGDTPGYVQSIAAFDRGGYPPHENPLWDSGHLLLRPMGWVFFRLLTIVAPHAFGPDPRLAICWGLIAASVLSGLLTVVLLRSLATRFTSGVSSNFIAAGFLCFYSFLNYLQTGTSYIVGLMWLTVSVWCAIRAVEAAPGLRYGILSGIAAALAVLFWLPYICALAGVLAVIALWGPKPERARIRLMVFCGVSAFALISAVYLAVIAGLGLHSPSQVGQWFLASGHGSSPTKRLLRIWTGLPRSCLWLGNDGMLIKRYVLHDPYAPVTLARIIAEQLWRMLVFYGFAVALVWGLFRSPGGNRMLAILASAAAPLFFFALAVFEPGSAERYLPLFPFLCVAVALLLARSASRLARIAVTAFLLIAIVTNISYLWRPALIAEARPTEERALALRGKVGAKGVVALVTLLDDLYAFAASQAVDPYSPVRVQLPVYDVIQVGNERIRTWKQEFAARVLAAFAAGDSAWVSKRLLAPVPRPAWAWTEGDDPRIAWRELRPFFTGFDFSEDVGGDDGFLRLSDSPRNRQILAAISHESSS